LTWTERYWNCTVASCDSVLGQLGNRTPFPVLGRFVGFLALLILVHSLVTLSARQTSARTVSYRYFSRYSLHLLTYLLTYLLIVVSERRGMSMDVDNTSRSALVNIGADQKVSKLLPLLMSKSTTCNTNKWW